MSLINTVFTFTSQTARTEGLNILDICLLAQNVMDGLNVTYALGVSVSLYVCALLCMRLCCLLPSDVSVVPVSLAGDSVSLVLTCSAVSCGIWHPLKYPPPSLHTHTQTHKHIHN